MRKGNMCCSQVLSDCVSRHNRFFVHFFSILFIEGRKIMCSKNELARGIARDTKDTVTSVGRGLSTGAYHQAKKQVQATGEAGVGMAYTEDVARVIGGAALDVARVTAMHAAKTAVVYQQEHDLTGPRLDSREVIAKHERLRQEFNDSVKSYNSEAVSGSAIGKIHNYSAAMQQEKIDYLMKNVAASSEFTTQLRDLSVSNYEAARVFRSMDDVKFVNKQADEYVRKILMDKKGPAAVARYNKASLTGKIIQLMRLLKEGGLSAQEIQHINDAIHAKHVLKYEGKVPLKNRRLKRYRRSVKGRLMKFLKQDEAGIGMAITAQATVMAVRVTKSAYRKAKGMLNNIKNASMLLYKTTASTKLARLISDLDNVRSMRDGIHSVAGTIQAGVSEAHIPEIRSRGNSMFQRIKSFRRDPFGMKRRVADLRKRAVRGTFRLAARPFKAAEKRFKRVHKVNKRARKIAEAINRLMVKFVQGIVTAVSFLMGLLFTLFGWLIFGALAVFAIIAVVANIFSIFSLDDYHFKKAKTAVYETVQKSYQEQLDAALPSTEDPFQIEQIEQINPYEGKYRQLQNVSFEFKSQRDDALYEKNDHKPDRGFLETTNTAELLSMAQIVYNFNLEHADLDELKEWTKGMYYGSHTVSIDEKNAVTNNKYKPTDETYDVHVIVGGGIDAGGNTHLEYATETRTRTHYSTLTRYDEDIILTTTYFPDLFSCVAGSLNGLDWKNVKGLSDAVLKHKASLITYATKYGIPDKVNLLMAIMQEESGGIGNDPMQASESKYGKIGCITNAEESLEQGCKYWASLFLNNPDMEVESIIQSYNYGGGFLDYVRSHGGKYTFELACEYAKIMNAKMGWTPQTVTYKNEISIPINGGWRYNYGNMFYVKLIGRHLASPAAQHSDIKCDSEKAQKIVDAAFSQMGVPYVWGGTSPGRGLDCSGLVQYCYRQAGISIGRTTWDQGPGGTTVTSPKPGDIVYYGSHVGIYIGDGKMVHAPQPGEVVKISNVNYRAHTYVRY